MQRRRPAISVILCFETAPIFRCSRQSGAIAKADAAARPSKNHSQLTNTQKRVADNSQQINTLNNHFDSLKNEVEDNRKEANAGTASAIAIASQPQVKTGDLMMVSAGAGTFNGESAVSVGTSFNAGTHTVLKAGISADTQSDFGAGVGVGYSF